MRSVSDSSPKRKLERHGKHPARLWSIYGGMKTRCYNKNYGSFKNYGGRGILVCDEWRDSFVAFRAWALSNGYTDALEIDRIDNDGNYEPSNCRWITAAEQCFNKRTNNVICIRGVSRTVTEWARDTECVPGYSAFRDRIRAGWNPELAFDTPGKATKLLTRTDASGIKKLLRTGVMTLVEIGRMFGVSPTTIAEIKHERNWRTVA